MGGSETNDVAVGELLLSDDADAVDQGAVRRSKVSRNVSVGAWSDAGVFAADVAVVDGDRVVGRRVEDVDVRGVVVVGRRVGARGMSVGWLSPPVTYLLYFPYLLTY